MMEKIKSTSKLLTFSPSPRWSRLLLTSTVFSTGQNNNYFLVYGKTRNTFTPKFHNKLFIIYTSPLYISYIQTSLKTYTSQLIISIHLNPSRENNHNSLNQTVITSLQITIFINYNKKIFSNNCIYQL